MKPITMQWNTRGLELGRGAQRSMRLKRVVGDALISFIYLRQSKTNWASYRRRWVFALKKILWPNIFFSIKKILGVSPIYNRRYTKPLNLSSKEKETFEIKEKCAKPFEVCQSCHRRHRIPALNLHNRNSRRKPVTSAEVILCLFPITLAVRISKKNTYNFETESPFGFLI